MANYTKTTNFKQKDTLATGDAQKIVKGGEVDTEFNNISTSVATKVDKVTVSSANLLAGNGSGGIADAGVLISDVVLYSGGAGLVETGMVTAYAGTTAPTGYLICDGSAVSRSAYATLYAITGDTYGAGNGTTTFNLPDLVGRVPIGAGTGDATDATAHALGDEGGTETHTLTEAEMPSHRHSSADGQQFMTYSAATGWYFGDPGVPISAATAYTAYTGGGGAHNIMQPYTTINYIIKT